MMRKLILDENNKVLNIIIDADNFHTGPGIIEAVDSVVGIGDTVNPDGTLKERRSDFVVPTEEERILEEQERHARILAELNNKI